MPDVLIPFLRQLDAKILESFELCTGISLTPLARQQALLPTRYCGLGLRESSKLAAISAEVPSCWYPLIASERVFAAYAVRVVQCFEVSWFRLAPFDSSSLLLDLGTVAS